MNPLERFSRACIVPVVVLDNVEDAVPTAKALLAGGIDVMEITFRTAAAKDSIAAVASACPDMLVGAGTVINLEQCKAAVSAGAGFIVSPGFDEEIIKYCIKTGITVTPGCVAPSEIMSAVKLGLSVVKFFPANVYGGLTALKSLSAPFPGVKFLPTGGINSHNIGDYIAAPFIHAVGGSWICTRKDIADGNFDKITALCREARQNALGFEFAHLGINCENVESSTEVSNFFQTAFDFPLKDSSSSVFASPNIEILKSPNLGAYGHIAIRTNNILCAVPELERAGFYADTSTAKYKDDRLVALYLKQEIGGFAIHLLQK